DEGGRLEDLAERIAGTRMRTFELPALGISADTARTWQDIDALVVMAKALAPDFVQLNVESAVDTAVIDSLHRAGDALGELGTRLAIEYLPWLPEIRNLKTTRSLLDRVQVDGAGVIVDSWHFFFSDDTWEDLEALPLDEISYIQFDDHPTLESDDLVAETLNRRAMPGEGHFELTRFCQSIRAKGYTGPVSCEILSDSTRHMPPGEFAKRVYDSARPFWS
ncbi:MAG: sugar phosphate isomerase/epimerase, partial [Dechloromonas sp.]|nr:sugar phosphate isomerase/epimerase [Dechloromonas sp.]